MQEDEEAEAVATATQVVMGVTAVTTVASAMTGATGASAVSGSSSGTGQSFWALINQYQLVLLIPMLNTYLANDFEFFITEFELVSFDFDFMDFIEFPLLDSEVEKIDYEQPQELFEKNGIESGSFFYNHYTFLKVMILVVISNLMFLLIKFMIVKLIKPKHKCWTTIFDKVQEFYHFSVYVKSLIEASLFMSIS